MKPLVATVSLAATLASAGAPTSPQLDRSAAQAFKTTVDSSCEKAFSDPGDIIISLSEFVILQFKKNGTPFMPANSTWTDNKMMMEFIPCHQTLDNWRDYFSITATRGLSTDSSWRPENSLPALGRRMESVCTEGNFVYKLLGNRKVDGRDASAAIVGCAKFAISLPTSERRGEGEIGYYVAIKGKTDGILLWRAIRVDSFDPSRPPISEIKLPDMPWIKICENKSSREQTITQCSNRKTR